MAEGVERFDPAIQRVSFPSADAEEVVMERSLAGDWVRYSHYEKAREERDLAIAHDRQPYPTAEAYEKVCAARTKWQARAEKVEAERDQARQQGAEEERERLRAALGDHWLAQVECDHEAKRDRPICGCSEVDLGWHPTVGAAVQAWIDHLFAALDNQEGQK